MVEETITPEALAQRFHETYERLASQYSYETRKASAVPWQDVPTNNKSLMIAVAADVLVFLHMEEAAPAQSARQSILGTANTRLLNKVEAFWRLIELYDDYLKRAVPLACESDPTLGAIRKQMQEYRQRRIVLQDAPDSATLDTPHLHTT